MEFQKFSEVEVSLGGVLVEFEIIEILFKFNSNE
jgi:hypothetical protein